jgi:hypothetical protein
MSVLANQPDGKRKENCSRARNKETHVQTPFVVSQEMASRNQKLDHRKASTAKHTASN